jgi:hypothetical protein
MSAYYARRRAAALQFDRPTGAAFRFTGESLQASGGLVSGWRDEVSGLVLPANGQIAYTPADARLNNQPTATISRTDYFGSFQLNVTGPLTVAIVCRLERRADEFYQSGLFVQQAPNGSFSGLNAGQYGRNPAWNGRGRDFVNTTGYDALAPRAHVASLRNAFDISTLRLFQNNTELSPLQVGDNVQATSSTCWIGHLYADTQFNICGPVAYAEGFTRVLTEDELLSLNGWLAQQYDLTELILD